jgi:dTDP-4-dehydrorhamnose reductase
MLGHKVAQLLENSSHEVFLSSREPHIETVGNRVSLNVHSNPEKRLGEIISETSPEYIVNCIGVIKQHVNERNLDDRLNMIQVNAEFPHFIARQVLGTKIRVIQIATDCVFDGEIGDYVESARHTPSDLYGSTKSIGEVESTNFTNLRCSIIGPEMQSHKSLLSWVINHGYEEKISGYINHFWNGITTLAFGKLVLGIIEKDLWRTGTFHVVPANKLSKYELVRNIAQTYERSDLEINRFETNIPVNRTLDTINPEYIASLWFAGGYSEVPTIEFLIAELRKFEKGRQ